MAFIPSKAAQAFTLSRVRSCIHFRMFCNHDQRSASQSMNSIMNTAAMMPSPEPISPMAESTVPPVMMPSMTRPPIKTPLATEMMLVI
ncbi:hypothetical protein CPB84DRAFT_1454790 [Gymnopilus junonius]|uniref:Uncharacterized protein n=1 Tax=Gymnopilus junonius TaxID=109634 RepID=A0A9P5NIV3_GYMJU|nr:hypothetical protein CPB84DRAFT_1454790 [Gymnopilus junonius]